MWEANHTILSIGFSLIGIVIAISSYVFVTTVVMPLANWCNERREEIMWNYQQRRIRQQIRRHQERENRNDKESRDRNNEENIEL